MMLLLLLLDNGTNATENISHPGYMIALRFFVSVFCILSIVGSMLIILAYFAFKETRTLAREFLVNLSIADLITALANLIGLLTNFERFGDDLDNNRLLSTYCTVQAFFAQFGTDSSILWTVIIALYMFLAIVMRKQSITDKLLSKVLCYITSWGIPAAILIWFAVAGFLGFEPNTTPGWCGIKSDPSYAVTVGYTMFVYFAFLLLPLISVTIICYLKIYTQIRGDYDPHIQSIARKADVKLTLIPLIFVFLRVWGLIVDIFTFQIHSITLKQKFEQSIIGQIMIILKGIGDSSQGFANSILFVGLTPTIRNNFVRILKKLFCCFSKNNSVHLNSVVTETTPMLNADIHREDSDTPPRLTYEIHTDS